MSIEELKKAHNEGAMKMFDSPNTAKNLRSRLVSWTHNQELIHRASRGNDSDRWDVLFNTNTPQKTKEWIATNSNATHGQAAFVAGLHATSPETLEHIHNRFNKENQLVNSFASNPNTPSKVIHDMATKIMSFYPNARLNAAASSTLYELAEKHPNRSPETTEAYHHYLKNY